jgi:hypothetical protein
MEKDSLKKGYKNRNSGNQDMVSYFTGSPQESKGMSGEFGDDWLKNLDNKPKAKPQPQSQPQAKPQPKKSEAPAQKPTSQKSSLTEGYKEKKEWEEAYDKEYGILKGSALELKGQELENSKAMFKESWEARAEGRPIPVRPGSQLDKEAREEGFGKLFWRRKEPGEKSSYKIDDDQSPEARKRRMDALSGSLAKLAPAKK